MTLVIQRPTSGRLVMAKGQPYPVDPQFTSVSLLLHGNGTNGSTVITDNSALPKTVTAFGDAKISTAQSKFGGSSIAFDGTGDGLSISHNPSLSFANTDNFTVEVFVRFSAKTNYAVIASKTGSNAISYSNWVLQLNATASAFAFFVGNTTAATTGAIVVSITGTTNPSINTWYHVAATKDGATYRLFVGGVLEGTTVNASTFSDGRAGPLVIGIDGGLSVAPLNGYIDDLRITKGVARYTANFTPPTAPFPDF